VTRCGGAREPRPIIDARRDCHDLLRGHGRDHYPERRRTRATRAGLVLHRPTNEVQRRAKRVRCNAGLGAAFLMLEGPPSAEMVPPMAASTPTRRDLTSVVRDREPGEEELEGPYAFGFGQRRDCGYFPFGYEDSRRVGWLETRSFKRSDKVRGNRVSLARHVQKVMECHDLPLVRKRGEPVLRRGSGDEALGRTIEERTLGLSEGSRGAMLGGGHHGEECSWNLSTEPTAPNE